MSRLWRVLTGAVMLAVLLGLPVAPVWCELACPQGEATVAKTPEAHAPSCHEASDDPSLAQPTASLATAPADACDHPTTLSARLADTRFSVPAPEAVVPLAQLAPLAAATAGRLALPAPRGPSPPRGPTFSSVLRI